MLPTGARLGLAAAAAAPALEHPQVEAVLRRDLVRLERRTVGEPPPGGLEEVNRPE